MKKITLSITTALLGLSFTSVATAQDLHHLFDQQQSHSNHVGLKLSIPLQTTKKAEEALSLNFGYSIKNPYGQKAFMPITGFNSNSGFHVMGVNKNTQLNMQGGNAMVYVVGGIVVLGGGFLLLNEVAQAAEGGR